MRGLTPAFAVAAFVAVVAAPRAASAGFFDFLFGNQPRQAPIASPGYAVDPTVAPPPQSLPPFDQTADAGGAYAHCVRICDGRHFPILARTGTTPTQLCQSFCPASATRVFFGSDIDNAMAANGERYSETDNAYLYRQRLSADCTCNGRDPAGLAPIDISLDTTLRPGDVVATATGLLAYRGRPGQSADFTPVADYPGLTAALRAKLGEMKVAPVSAELTDNGVTTTGSIPQPSATKRSTGAAARRLSLREMSQ